MLVLPKVTPIAGFAIPDGLRDRPLTLLISDRTTASTYLGSVPPGVDFTKEFLAFYAGGAQPTLGNKTSIGFDDIRVTRTPLSEGCRYELTGFDAFYSGGGRTYPCRL